MDGFAQKFAQGVIL